MRTILVAALLKFYTSKRGATAIEYGLIAGLVSIGIVAGLSVIGDSLTNTFNEVSNGF
jgi:pilus assembly protein Flp/PilA